VEEDKGDGENEDQNQNNTVSVNMTTVEEELQKELDLQARKLNISRHTVEEVDEIIQNSDLDKTEKDAALNVVNETKGSGFQMSAPQPPLSTKERSKNLRIPDHDSEDYRLFIAIVSVAGFLVVAFVGSCYLHWAQSKVDQTI